MSESPRPLNTTKPRAVNNAAPRPVDTSPRSAPPKSEPVYRKPPAPERNTRARGTGGHEQARRGASPRTRKAARTTRKVIVRAATSRPARRAGTSIGAVLVLITGAGIAFAVIRQPALVTGPIGFVAELVQRMGQVFGGKVVTVQAPGAPPLTGQKGVPS